MAEWWESERQAKRELKSFWITCMALVDLLGAAIGIFTCIFCRVFGKDTLDLLHGFKTALSSPLFFRIGVGYRRGDINPRLSFCQLCNPSSSAKSSTTAELSWTERRYKTCKSFSTHSIPTAKKCEVQWLIISSKS